MSLRADLAYALRLVRRSPAFAAVTIAIFALGIGASTAIFSVVNGVLLRPLPYPSPDRIVQLWEINAHGAHVHVADPNYDDIAAASHAFSATAEMADLGEMPVAGGAEPVRAHVAWVSRDFFRVLDVAPQLGRGFSDDEMRIGGRPVALVSYGFWQREFAGSRSALGATLHIEGQPYTIVGVLPSIVDEPAGAEIWMPREQQPRYPSRSAHNWLVLARLRDGVTVDAARRDVSGIMKSLKQRYGDQVSSIDGTVVSLREQLAGSTRPTLLVLFGASLVLLLIACTNAVNLLIARMASRQSEIAVRTALGAGRGRLVRQFLAESLVLSLAGGIVGVVLAQLGVRAMLALQTGQLPRASDVTVDWRVLAFALGVSLAAGTVMAVVAAWRAGAADLRGTMSEAQRTVSGGGSLHRIRSGLVIAQFAMTLMMLVAAGLLARSFQRLLEVQPGFATSNAVVLDLAATGGSDSASLATRVRTYDAIAAQLATVPGVARVGAVGTLPLALEGMGDGTFLIMDGPNAKFDPSQFETLFHDPVRTGQAEFRVAGPGYFEAMHIPVIGGRTFGDGDTYTSPNAAVISQSLADEKWKGRDPVGQVLEFGNMDGDLRLLTVVGVVGDVRESNLAAPPRPTLYVDYRQRPNRTESMNFVVSTRGDETPVIAAARRIARQLAPDSPPRVRTIEDVVSTSLADRRFVLVLVGAFGTAALVLAALGIYGVLSYLVAERRREIAVRLALGASAAQVLRLVIAQGALLALIGIAVGTVASFAAMKAVAGMLYGVGFRDPIAFAAVAALLGVVAVVACWIPARRAAGVEPAEALRA